MHIRIVSAFALVLMLAAHAAAHVFWLQPLAFRVAPGELVKLQFHVGDRLPGDVVARDDSRIVKFVWSGPEGEKPVVGRDADEVAGIAKFKAPGFYVFGYQSSPSALTLDAAKFDSYLHEEGLENIAAARAGTTGESVRELFARCAKTLLIVGDPGADAPGFDRVLGLGLELVPETSPLQAAHKGGMTFRLERAGKPVADVLVRARRFADWNAPISARTSADGRAALPIIKPGIWVINAVDMSKAADGKADWESAWASLTFEVIAQ